MYVEFRLDIVNGSYNGRESIKSDSLSTLKLLQQVLNKLGLVSVIFRPGITWNDNQLYINPTRRVL